MPNLNLVLSVLLTGFGSVWVAGHLKEAREATNKADGIESAVYDLRAVNPNRKADVDRRTPADLLDLIEVKGREVAEALATLRALTDTP